MTQGQNEAVPQVGRDTVRVDARAKVTGQARYAGDVSFDDMVHAVLVPATVARGRITGLDVSTAEASAGVLADFTHENLPRIRSSFDETVLFIKGFMPLQDTRIHHAGQPVAIVVADTAARARWAARLVRAEYDAASPEVVLDRDLERVFTPPPGFSGDNRFARGDVETGLREADVVTAADYSTPLQQHAAMEPSAVVARWKADRLEVHDCTQGVAGTQVALQQVFDLPATRVRVLTPYIGGGFGGKGPVWPHTLFTAVIARELSRPVKLVLSRADTYVTHGHRSETRQQIRLAARADGRLTAIDHTVVEQMTRTEADVFNSATPTRSLYACPNVRTTTRGVRLDYPVGNFIRSPESAVNHVLESAMDELAYDAGLDPVELRVRNYSDTNLESGERHGSNYLRECYRRGAEIFGWDRRDPRPGATTDDNGDLVGWGMATAAHTTGGDPGSAAAVTLGPDGRASIRSGTVDMGTGTYTVMRQMGADTIGLPLEHVTFDLGDSDYPAAFLSAISATVPSTGSAVVRAAAQARERLLRVAVEQTGSPLLGLDPGDVEISGGVMSAAGDPGRRISVRRVMRRHRRPLVGRTEAIPTPLGLSFGAYFVEVRVTPSTGRVRVTRIVGVFDPGRVLNPRTARSQAIGGAIWGVGIALTEHSLLDPTSGRNVTANLSSYLIPVHADIPEIEVEFIDEPDPRFPLGARGFGEVPSTGASAAIGNAVHHAIGARIRDLPITQDKVIAALRA